MISIMVYYPSNIQYINHCLILYVLLSRITQKKYYANTVRLMCLLLEPTLQGPEYYSCHPVPGCAQHYERGPVDEFPLHSSQTHPPDLVQPPLSPPNVVLSGQKERTVNKLERKTV